MLDYMSIWHSLVFKAVHQNCLQTYPFTQQHEWAICYVPSAVLSPGESRNESSQGTAMCYLVAQVTTKERTAKCVPLKVHTHSLTHTHTHTHTQDRNKPGKQKLPPMVSPMQLVILQIFTEHELHANSRVSDTDQVFSFTKFIDIARRIDHIINEQDNFSYWEMLWMKQW